VCETVLGLAVWSAVRFFDHLPAYSGLVFAYVPVAGYLPRSLHDTSGR